MSGRVATRLAHNVLAATFVIVAAGMAVMGIIHARNSRLLSVQTDSMLPAIRPGDALVVSLVRPDSLRLGDIVSYRSPRDPNLIISHRLTGIDSRTGWLTTTGDALDSPDPTFPPDLLVGRVTAVAPHLGMLLDAVHLPIGLFITVYIPAAAIMVGEARRLAYVYARPLYSVRLKE